MVVGVAFIQLPAATGSLGLVVAWFAGLLLALALVLWMHMHLRPDDTGG